MRLWLKIILSIAASFALIAVGFGIGYSGAATKTVTVVKKVPVTKVVTKKVPVIKKVPIVKTVYKTNTVWRTKTKYVKVPAKPTPAPAAPASGVLLSQSGTGSWNSEPFTVNGDAPQLKVTYWYTGNATMGSGDNFIADITSSDDMLSIANDIATSGGKTTTVYPDVSYGGSHVYHLEVEATGSWHFTVTQAG